MLKIIINVYNLRIYNVNDGRRTKVKNSESFRIPNDRIEFDKTVGVSVKFKAKPTKLIGQNAKNVVLSQKNRNEEESKDPQCDKNNNHNQNEEKLSKANDLRHMMRVQK